MNSLLSLRARLPFVVLLFLCSLIISSCELAQNYTKHDREKNLEQQDYRDALAPREVEIDHSANASSANIPALKPYVAEPDSNYASCFYFRQPDRSFARCDIRDCRPGRLRCGA